MSDGRCAGCGQEVLEGEEPAHEGHRFKPPHQHHYAWQEDQTAPGVGHLMNLACECGATPTGTTAKRIKDLSPADPDDPSYD